MLCIWDCFLYFFSRFVVSVWKFWFLYANFISCSFIEFDQIQWLSVAVFRVCFFFFLEKIRSFTNRDNFTSSFPIQMPFLSFCCLTALVRTSSAMLKSGGDSKHLCLIPDLRGKVFNLSPLSTILAVGLSHIAFIMLRYVSSISNLLRAFIMNGCWILLLNFRLY